MIRAYTVLSVALAACACRDTAPALPVAEQPPADVVAEPETSPELAPRDHDRRGDEHLLAGRFALAVADFDRFLAAHPDFEPQHWRRGIAYYYAGQYDAGIAQFELHRSVNPADVENATWHYLCTARAKGVEAARAALLPVGRDGRTPMAEVYELYAERATAADVLRAAGDDPDALFYAHLYIGLHHEASGRSAEAREHIGLAATTFARPHYMGDVARVHAALLAD